MRPQYPLGRRGIAEPTVADKFAARAASPASATAAPLPVTPVPDAMVLRVYTRVGGRLDGTCPLAD